MSIESKKTMDSTFSGEVITVLRELQDFTRQRRLRWKGLFKDFDRHNRKLVSEHSFHRALVASNFNFSNNQVSVLTEAFRSKTDSCQVDYQSFCDCLNEVFTLKNLELNPTKEIILPLPAGVNRHYITAVNSLSEQEEEEAAQILFRLGSKCKTNGVVIKFFFLDFDKHSNGHVTKEQFRRGLKQMSRLEVDERYVNVLLKKYEDTRGDINYRRFARDAEQMVGAMREMNTSSKKEDAIDFTNINNGFVSSDYSYGKHSSIKSILKQMQNVIQTQGIRTKSFFKDFDKLRRGKVIRSQFIATINSAFGKLIYMSPEQQEELADMFSDGSRSVLYEEFIDMVEPDRANLRSLLVNPTQEARDIKQPFGDSDVTVIMNESAEALVERISSRVKTSRMHLKPLFEDFDRRHRGVITPAQFRRVLAQELASLSLTEDDLTQLGRTFASRRTVGVDYLKFIKVVEGGKQEDAGRAFSAPHVPLQTNLEPSTVNTSNLTSPTNNNQTYEDVLYKLQRITKTRRIRLREFLEDADVHRHGLISVQQFSQGLSRANIELNQDQIETLISPHRETNNSYSRLPLIKWRDLAQDVDSAEIIIGLEKKPNGISSPKPIPNGKQLGKYNLSDPEKYRLEGILKNIRQYVETNRILFSPTFQSFDKLNVGKLPKSLFRRALDSLNLKILRDLEEEDYDLLCKAFLEEGASQDVQYRDFIRQVDNSTSALRGAGISAHQIAEQTAALMRMNNSNEKDKSSESPEIDFEDLIKRVQDACWSRRIRIKDFLQDFDRLRKGLVVPSKFKSALTMCGLEITSDEIELLTNAYRCASDPAKISYMGFVHLIDGGNERLEVDPTITYEDRKSRKFDERHPRQVNQHELNEVMHPIRKVFKLRNVLLMDAFQRYDKQNLKAITLSQFMSVLKTNGLLDQIDYEHAARTLHKGFPAAHAEKVNYRKFVVELNK